MDEVYVAARRVLLDGLDALDDHRAAVILVGAQAIYLRVGEGDLAVAPYTTDGDLAIDPSRLRETPPLEQALQAAGFRPESASSVGIWVTTRTLSTGSAEISMDLLLPETAGANPKSREGRLPGHANKAVRNVAGLDGAFVDQDPMSIGAFDENDRRTFEIAVAGPAAMLIAKLRKIEDRSGSKRSKDKDALDVLRLLRGPTLDDMATRYRRILDDVRSRSLGEAGKGLLQRQFVQRGGIGGEMITRAVGVLADPEELTESARALGADLLAALK